MAIACTSPALATRSNLTSEVSTWRIDVTDEGLIFVQELRGGSLDDWFVPASDGYPDDWFLWLSLAHAPPAHIDSAMAARIAAMERMQAELLGRPPTLH